MDNQITLNFMAQLLGFSVKRFRKSNFYHSLKEIRSITK